MRQRVVSWLRSLRWSIVVNGITLVVTLALFFWPHGGIGQEPGALTPAQQLDADEADKLSTHADELYDEGKYREATPISQKALALRERSLGPDHSKTATGLNNLALLYNAQGDYAAAEPLYQRALVIKEKVLGPEHTSTAVGLNNLAELYREQANYAAAEPLYQRALKIDEKNWGPEHPETAVGLNNLALLYVAQANFSAAEPLYQRALKIREKSLGPDHPKTALSLNALAGLYQEQANFTAAEPLYQRALKITENVHGPEHPYTAVSLNNLAEMHRDQGNYAAAEPLYQRALKIKEKVLGPEHPKTAISLNNLALLYDAQANFAAAEPLLERAMKITEKAQGPEHPFTAIVLNNLAVVHKAQANYAAAEPLYQRALKITEKMQGPEHPDTAVKLNNLAQLYLAQANFVAAEPLFQRAIKIYERSFGPEHPATATSLTNLAGLYHDQANFTAAEPLYQRALKIRKKVLGPQHPDTATNLNHLATLQEAMRNPNKAAKSFDAARRSTLQHVAHVLPALDEREQALFLRHNYKPDFHCALSQGWRHRDDAKAAAMSASWLVNGKGVAHNALAQRNLLTRDTIDPRLKLLVKQLLETQQQLATLAMATIDPEQAEARQQAQNRLTADEARLAHELSSSTGGQTAASADWVVHDDLRKQLPADSMLIDLVRFDEFNFDAVGNESQWRPAHYSAWLTPAAGQGDVRLIDLGLAEPIDKIVKQVRESIAAAYSRQGPIQTEGEATAEQRLRAELRQVADLVWKPLAPHLGETRQIILSPDGALWLLPWAALPIGDDKYLLEEYALRMVISGRDVMSRGATKQTQTPPTLFADPDYGSSTQQTKQSIQAVFPKLELNDEGNTRSLSAKSLFQNVSRLPNTATEAAAIAPSLQQLTKTTPQVYKDRYALETILKRVKHPSVLVLSTHGFFLPEQQVKLDDRQLLSNDSRSATLATDGKPIENPLLRCGLLFAGCTSPQSTAGDDGVLTGMEVVSLDLRGTDLVVLSACETGVGKVNNGEGVAGLRQAFQLAGAKSVVATLWQVPDRDSALIMNDFFTHLAAGESRAEALRHAQLNRIEARRARYAAAHPLYWAAWTITGG